MAKYITKRVLISIPVLIGVVFIVFIMMNVVPGDPVTLMLGEHIKLDVVERVTEQMHLNDPVLLRFVKYIWDALHGDLGTSYKLNRTITSLIAGAFPNTIILAVAAAVIAWTIGITAGIVSAIKKGSFMDHFCMGFALVGVSMPVFWSALLLQYILAFKLGWLPVSGFTSWKHVIMLSLIHI